MNNYNVSDLNFFKQNFHNYEKTKKNLIVDKNVPHNYNHLIESGSRSFLYELGYKKAYSFLITDSFPKKCNYIDSNFFFDIKYSTIYPKSKILGQEPDHDFSKKVKRIGDISFEEESNEIENVKNMSRLPPDNLTEEWLKANLHEDTEILRLDNCYWLSRDVISKIGRMDPYLKELSLRNLCIDNTILLNILKHSKRLEKLDLSYCVALTSGICEIIANNCLMLKSLKVFSLVRAISNEGLENLSQLEHLSELDIGLCSMISDDGLLDLISNPVRDNKLTLINLTGLIKITNKGIIEILNKNVLSLKTVVISLLPQKSVTGEICSYIAKCKKITDLDISGCVNLDSDSVGNLFSAALENLEKLNLSGLTLLDDNDAVASLASNKPLRVLRMSNCMKLTINILEYIINNNTELLLLEINRTPLIPDSKIEETLKKKAPNLRIIRATNTVWNLKNTGYKVPLVPVGYTKPTIKGVKQTGKKNDDKNPVNLYKKFIEENKPKRIIDFSI